MKILAIGDPHGNLAKLKKIPKKKVDLIILTGDLGKADLARKQAFENVERRNKGLPEKEFSKKELRAAFMEPYNSAVEVVKYLARFAPVYTIYGNIDFTNADTRRIAKKDGIKLPFLSDTLARIPGVRIINNRIANFQGVRIGGLEYFVDTCWVQEFKPADYRKRFKKAKQQTDKAQKILKRFGKLDILVHHQPPYGVLDKVGKMAPKHWRGKHAGSKIILSYIKKMQPTYALCGHIHEGEGHKKIGKTHVYNLGVANHVFLEMS